MEATGPNADQIRYWNESAGAKWVALQDRLDAQLAPAGLDAIERLGARAGERVVDVGCGCGASSLELARRIGPGGSVLGVDLSAGMLARARERALAAGLAHASFVDADAQTYAFEPARADAVFSRFGVMFFHDPVAAFANLRGALRPGGRAGLLCWQAFERNPWMALPAAAAARHVPMPPRPSPGAPGPFGLADPTHVRAVLEGAGFADVALDPIETSLIVGGTPDLDEAAAFATLFGPTAAVLRDAPAGLVQEVQASVREALAPYHTAEGVRLSASLWFVRARRA